MKLLGSLDAAIQSSELAEEASYSRAQFYRKVRQSFGGSPMALRRRLLLERAAYELTHSTRSIGEIGIDATFDSSAGFCRAFRKAYGIAPTEYRKLKPTDYRIAPTERLHFSPSEIRGRGKQTMTTPELMVNEHADRLRSLLDIFATWPAEELDQTTKVSANYPWESETATIRQTLGWSAAFAAPWMHAINGIESEYTPKDLDAMREALDRGQHWFNELIRTVADDNTWELTFVDSVCEPPEVFSYGSIIGHTLNFNAYRTMVLVHELRIRGHKDVSLL